MEEGWKWFYNRVTTVTQYIHNKILIISEMTADDIVLSNELVTYYIIQWVKPSTICTALTTIFSGN